MTTSVPGRRRPPSRSSGSNREPATALAGDGRKAPAYPGPGDHLPSRPGRVGWCPLRFGAGTRTGSGFGGCPPTSHPSVAPCPPRRLRPLTGTRLATGEAPDSPAHAQPRAFPLSFGTYEWAVICMTRDSPSLLVTSCAASERKVGQSQPVDLLRRDFHAMENPRHRR